MPYKTPLAALWALHKFNLADDGFGTLFVVPGHSWTAAYYHAHGV